MNATEAASLPPTQTDTHTAITQLAQRITERGRPSQRFRESEALRKLRQQARQTLGMAARDLWKQVFQAKETRAPSPGMGNWWWQPARPTGGRNREIQQTKARVGWQHALTDDAAWKSKLVAHFKGIFAKAPPERTRRRLRDTRGALARLCKHTPWVPFTGDDLLLATRTWKHNKATGPDSVTHELLRMLLQQPVWEGRILHMVNDFLYKGEIPAAVLQGMTILLPKTQGDPPTWGDTRPITLSSAVLKWFAQLLLLRGGKGCRRTRPTSGQGWGSRHPSCWWSSGGWYVMPKNGGSQHGSLSLMSGRRLTVSGRRVWVIWWHSALGGCGREAGERREECRGRQGRGWACLKSGKCRWPSATVLRPYLSRMACDRGPQTAPSFSAASWGTAWNRHSKKPSTFCPQPKVPPRRSPGGAFMDDTYLWSHDPIHLQATLTALGKTPGAPRPPHQPGEDSRHLQPATRRGGVSNWRGHSEMQALWGSHNGPWIPITFGESVAAIITEMNHRARKAFHKHAALLCAETPLKGRFDATPNPSQGGSVVGGASMASYRWHSPCHQHPPSYYRYAA